MKLSDKDKRSKLVVVDSIRTPHINSCLSVHLSKERTIFICYQFFKQEKSMEERNQSILMVCSMVYIDACKWLRLKHIVYGTELKNIVERFIQQIKDRTECFDDHFPCIKDGCNMQHVWNWLRMFLLYLHMETDRIMFTNFLIKYS
jgi:putative transposase